MLRSGWHRTVASLSLPHVRAVEDRAHAEVDLAREELKRQRQEATQRDHRQQRELAVATQRKRADGLRGDAERTVTELTTRLEAMTAAATKRARQVDRPRKSREG